MSAYPVDDQLIADVARSIVAQAAPQELPLFRATSAQYFTSSRRDPVAGERQDQMLGFGAAEAGMFLTPFVLTVAQHVVPYLAAQVVAALKTSSNDAINAAVRSLFARLSPAPSAGPAPASAIRFDHEQMLKVRELAFEKAREMKLPPAKANLIADALIGSMSLASA